MTIMNTELYEALKEAGASDEKAKAASNVVEEQNKRFDGLDQAITGLHKDLNHRSDNIETVFQGDIKRLETELGSKIDNVETRLGSKIDKVEAVLAVELKILKWIGGVVAGATIGILVKLLFYST